MSESGTIPLKKVDVVKSPERSQGNVYKELARVAATTLNRKVIDTVQEIAGKSETERNAIFTQDPSKRVYWNLQQIGDPQYINGDLVAPKNPDRVHGIPVSSAPPLNRPLQITDTQGELWHITSF